MSVPAGFDFVIELLFRPAALSYIFYVIQFDRVGAIWKTGFAVIKLARKKTMRTKILD